MLSIEKARSPLNSPTRSMSVVTSRWRQAVDATLSMRQCVDGGTVIIALFFKRNNSRSIEILVAVFILPISKKYSPRLS